jgi:diguanylate cyclase (GGDEF)-like protein
MISHITHVFDDVRSLDITLCCGPVAEAAKGAKSILVQVYCAETDPEHIGTITACIGKRLPQSVVVGCTTMGEIARGRLLTNRTVIGFTFFGSSEVIAIALPCVSGEEHRVGAELGRRIAECSTRVAGVLLLATPASINGVSLIAGWNSTGLNLPVFGGGAADYDTMKASLVFTGTERFSSGVVVVALGGDDLHVEAQTYMGWRPLSKSMRVTEVDGLLIKRIDGAPAFDMYEHYLDISKDQDFSPNAMEFPMLVERDGMLVARVPSFVTDEGALMMMADIAEGETFRLGYGDLDLIVNDARNVHRVLTDFGSQVNLLYSCCIRRFLMQQDVELETLPFETSAPTFGFYTFGEFYGTRHLTLMNSTMVAVGLREGAAPARAVSEEAVPSTPVSVIHDPYANKHGRIIARLMHFIQAVTLDLEAINSNLEAANREITRLSLTDQLTQLPNRARLDQALVENLELSTRYGDDFSVVLLDIDHFKQVNDTYGHLVGDTVLIELGQILAHQTRATDVAGRWGGEEFLIVAPHTSLEKAAKLAEKVRSNIASSDFSVVGYQTISLGVAAYSVGDDLDKLLGRADAALYRAKRSGRNRVELGTGESSHPPEDENSKTISVRSSNA